MTHILCPYRNKFSVVNQVINNLAITLKGFKAHRILCSCMFLKHQVLKPCLARWRVCVQQDTALMTTQLPSAVGRGAGRQWDLCFPPASWGAVGCICVFLRHRTGLNLRLWCLGHLSKFPDVKDFRWWRILRKKLKSQHRYNQGLNLLPSPSESQRHTEKPLERRQLKALPLFFS